MDMMDTFWHTIALYNAATWGYQLVLIGLGLLLLGFFRWKAVPWLGVMMKAYFIILYLWIAVVYFEIYCVERSYHRIMALFWGILAGVWVWDLLAGYTLLVPKPRYPRLGYLLVLTPLLYPLFSLLRGLEFPSITSPVMPCSVVVFTIGVLLLYGQRVSLFTVLLLCHWSVIGLSKTLFFNIPEDYLMACATLPAIYLFFRDYFLKHTDAQRQKPNGHYIKWLLLAVCVGAGVILLERMWAQLSSLL